MFSSCTFRSCCLSTSPDSVPPTISFWYCRSILSIAALRSFLKPCTQRQDYNSVNQHTPSLKQSHPASFAQEHVNRSGIKMVVTYIWGHALLKINRSWHYFLGKSPIPKTMTDSFLPCLLLVSESQSSWVSGRHHSRTLQTVWLVLLAL